MTKPNILLIVSDDHGYGDRSALSRDEAVRTPALDRIARDGVSCTDAYVAAPICNPSRGALSSGSYPARWGSTWFLDTRFPEGSHTLAERLGEAGYRTGYFGKVHDGQDEPGDRACPPEHGFDESYYGLAGRQQGRLHYMRHSRAAVDEYGPEGNWRMGVQPMFEGRDEVELDGFLTDEIGERSRSFMAREDERPFFAMVAFNAVHNFCWQLPPEELKRRGLPARADWRDGEELSFADWYDGATDPNLPDGRAYYLAQLELMDRQIGLMLDQLDEHGIADDTIVIYLTDNGGSTCNYGDNAPLRGTKYTLYEGGVRVPFLVRWPAGGWSGGQTRDGIVASIDISTTLTTVAEADGAPDDGIDQSEHLRGGPPVRDEMHWECAFQAAVRHSDFKLKITHGDDPSAEGIRRVEHAEPGDGVELFDVRRDPAEECNLASARSDLVTSLWDAHATWLRDVGRSDLIERHEAAVHAHLRRSLREHPTV